MSSQIALCRKCIVTLVTFVWFFSTVSFYMSLQSTWKRRKKVALVTFVRLFTKMSFQMNSQMACLLFPFSIVSCQMFSQIACSRGCKNTLVTFVRLFSFVIVMFFSSLTQISICIFNDRIRIRILFCFPKMTEYEYKYYSAFQKWPNTNIIRLSEYKYYLASEVWQNILKYIAEKS